MGGTVHGQSRCACYLRCRLGDSPGLVSFTGMLVDSAALHSSYQDLMQLLYLLRHVATAGSLLGRVNAVTVRSHLMSYRRVSRSVGVWRHCLSCC